MHAKILWLARALVVLSLVFPATAFLADEVEQQQQQQKKCRWWQFGRCDENQEYIEGLPPEAPREGTVITVDVSKNVLYLFQDGELVRKSAAATGSDKVLKKGRRTWLFRTPRGRHKVLRKIEDPVWRKPDWAFVEEGQKVPAANSPKRLVKGKLGKYALDLGDGILIHGTKDVKSFGKKASHGCIRLPDDMLSEVYHAAAVGTEVWVFDSVPPPQQARGPESGRSDLDF